ncbi:hypothetical protein FHX82_000882 [Amycolatopsis bartoniae]|uniref:Uncharacterized protein n=1 Tax=Amycolatopsis bartoniae TaxID=941986 RepID=A0A8H9MEE6_9PSEU|nr:hypothetical protein [Amycolatopsis bartoniae]MBB2933862.1 hypothetical protein [Amycolatopsis bartoniae]TVT00566.1 hypothetical protein FNH07_31480 [Amycolatopsis bartoniae]GHF87427.1 hypothetical protein GCM10017566_71490 [Amycolatopsis bartoniae]
MDAGEEPARPPGWDGWWLAGALLCALASAATFASSFLTLFATQALSVTGWESRPASAGVVRNGYPLAVAGALLAIAALFAVITAARLLPDGVALLTTALAAAFLAGVLVTIGAQAAHATPGAGFWLALAAAVSSLAAAAPAALPRRSPY